MECPKCGYMMDAFTVECPRCKKMDGEIRQAITQNPVITPTPAKPVMSTRDSIILWVSLIGFSIFLFFLWRALLDDGTQDSHNHTPPASTQTTEIHPNFQTTVAEVYIKNKDGITWTDITIRLNPGLLGGGYAYHIDSLKSGDRLIIPFGEFADNGKRFNPFETKVEGETVECSTANGHGFWVGK